MPYKDPAKKKAQMARWRKESIEKGYGKWLYNRRKLRFDDAERFRAAIGLSLDVLQSTKKPADKINKAIELLSGALAESMKVEEELGRFKKGEVDGNTG